MKKLKKLVLNKEKIVNLNDYEMQAINGGATTVTTVTKSSKPCIAVGSYVVSKIADYIVDNYILTPPPPAKQSDYQNAFGGGNISESYFGDGSCMIDEVVVVCY